MERPRVQKKLHHPHVEVDVSIGVIQTFVGHMSGRMVSSGAARKAVELLDSDPILVPSDISHIPTTGRTQ
jgi:hypothetical protein